MLKGAGSPVLVQTASNLCTFSHNANKSLKRLKGSLSLSLSSAATTKYDSKSKKFQMMEVATAMAYSKKARL